jgi:hypothetical protein
MNRERIASHLERQSKKVKRVAVLCYFLHNKSLQKNLQENDISTAGAEFYGATALEAKSKIWTK